MKYLILALLFVSCGRTIRNTETVEVIENRPHFESIKCDSDGSYTECTVMGNALNITSLLPYRAEDCLRDKDYYLLSEKVLVVKNNCRATFIVEVE